MLTSQNLLYSTTAQTSHQKHTPIAHTSHSSILTNNINLSFYENHNQAKTQDLHAKNIKFNKYSTINRRTSSLTTSSINRKCVNSKNLKNNNCDLLKQQITLPKSDNNLYYFNNKSTNDKISTISSSTSTVLSRFFQRSSPFRRSTATCSSYSSSTSGYSGISSASPTSSVNSKDANSQIITVFQPSVSTALQLTHKNRNTNFCFNLLCDSSKYSKNQKSKIFKQLKNNNKIDAFNIINTKNNFCALDEFIDQYSSEFDQYSNKIDFKVKKQQQNLTNTIIERSASNVNEINERREKALSTYDNI